MTACDDWLSTLETARSEREAAAEAQRWADRADAMGYLLTCLIEWGAPDPTPIAPDEVNSCGLRFSVNGEPEENVSKLGYMPSGTHVRTKVEKVWEWDLFALIPIPVRRTRTTRIYEVGGYRVSQRLPPPNHAGIYISHTRSIDSTADIDPSATFAEPDRNPE